MTRAHAAPGHPPAAASLAVELFERLAADYLGGPGVTAGTGFGGNSGLRLEGRICAMTVRGRLVVKLAAEQARRAPRVRGRRYVRARPWPDHASVGVGIDRPTIRMAGAHRRGVRVRVLGSAAPVGRQRSSAASCRGSVVAGARLDGACRPNAS